jgi:SagB-type dehydrogenase family enzyme
MSHPIPSSPSRLAASAVALATGLLAAHCNEPEPATCQDPPVDLTWGSSLPADTGDVVTLPAPTTSGGTPLRDTLSARRSERTYTDDPVSLDHLSQLLWAAQGITNQYEKRTVPSAGSKYPFELYAIAQNAEGLDPGLYHYRIGEHVLAKIKDGVLGEQVASIASEQAWLSAAPLYLVLVGVVPRTAAKYDERAEQYVLIEGGGIMQAVLLQVVDLGLGGVPIGSFDDTEMQELIGTDAMPVLIIAIGHSAD